MRLIDADALKQTFCAECNHSIKCDDCDIDYHFNHAPTVDAVEVVRCKDCFYYGEHTNYIKGKFCIKHSHLNDDFMFHCGEDDYCIWGERKTDEID